MPRKRASFTSLTVDKPCTKLSFALGEAGLLPVFLLQRTIIWPYASATAEMVRHGALIAAIGLPVLWVTCDFLRKVRSEWRCWSPRPYL